jgi:hypothetical protein
MSDQEEKRSGQEERLIAGYGELADFLTDQGFKISRSTVTKICAPSVATGPPCEGYFGRYPIFRPSRSLSWAKARLRPSKRGLRG